MDKKIKIELAFKHQKFSGLIINGEFVDGGEVVRYIFDLERRLEEVEKMIESKERIIDGYIDKKLDLQEQTYPSSPRTTG